MEVRYRHAETVTYLVPLTTRRAPDAGDTADETTAQAVVARLAGSGEPAQLLDGSQVPGVFETLLQMVVGRRNVRTTQGALVGRREPGLTAHAGRGAGTLRARPIREQPFTSNSLASYGDRLVMKLYRVLEEGPTRTSSWAATWVGTGSARVPAVLGSSS